MAEVTWRLTNWRTLPTLRPAEVAIVTGLGLAKVRRLLSRGDLRRAPVPGRAVLVPVSEVLRLVGEVEPAQVDHWIELTARALLDRADSVIKDGLLSVQG